MLFFFQLTDNPKKSEIIIHKGLSPFFNITSSGGKDSSIANILKDSLFVAQAYTNSVFINFEGRLSHTVSKTKQLFQSMSAEFVRFRSIYESVYYVYIDNTIVATTSRFNF